MSTISLSEICTRKESARRTPPGFQDVWQLLDLGEHEVRAGAAQLALNIVLPEGHKFNLDAPFFMRWSTANPAGLRFGLQSDKVDFRHVSFPLDVPIEPLNGRSEVTIDTIVYYCTTPSSACYVDPIRAKLALKASPSAPGVVPVEIAVKKP